MTHLAQAQGLAHALHLLLFAQRHAVRFVARSAFEHQPWCASTNTKRQKSERHCAGKQHQQQQWQQLWQQQRQQLSHRSTSVCCSAVSRMRSFSSAASTSWLDKLCDSRGSGVMDTMRFVWQPCTQQKQWQQRSSDSSSSGYRTPALPACPAAQGA
jgi:hypothetical protein